MTARRWFAWLAGVAALLFVVLLVTGVVLIFEFEPSGKFLGSESQPIAGAVGRIDTVRTLHRAASFALIPVAAAAAIAAVLGSTRRVAVGVLGFAAVIVATATGVSGQAIAWSQVAVWAVVDHIDKGFGPIFGGSPIRFVIVGNHEIGIDAFRRWVVLHVAVLPIVLVGVGVSLAWLMRRRPSPG